MQYRGYVIPKGSQIIQNTCELSFLLLAQAIHSFLAKMAFFVIQVIIPHSSPYK